jgi:pimeloyl-ACP methyl ester carboxylesterase
MTGIPNFGNTCYFNSALQCLLQIPQLSNYFITADDYTGPCEITREYQKVVRSAWTSKTDRFIDVRPLLGLYLLPKLFAPTTPRRIVAVAAEASARNPVHMYVSFYRTFKLPELNGQATCPVLIMTGEHDGVTPPAGGREAATILGDKATMIEVEAASHGIAEEAADVVIRNATLFISNL